MTEQVYQLIHSRTAARPITISQIRAETGLSERAIKRAVRDLRLAGQPIGSGKGKQPGYYYALTPDEVSTVSERLFHEGRSMMVAGSRMAGKHAQAERLGQLTLQDFRLNHLDLGERDAIALS